MPKPIGSFQTFIHDGELTPDEETGEVSNEEIRELIAQKLVEHGHDARSDVQYTLHPGVFVSVVVVAAPGEPGHSQFVKFDSPSKRISDRN